MASHQNGSSLEFYHGHKREQSQDSGAYIDWNSEDSASPVGNADGTGNEDFVTVVAVENGSETEPTSFVTILAIGEAEEIEEEVLVYRLPGERLGFGLKFEGGTNTAENVKRLFIQSSAPDSPASRAKCSWGFLVEGDEILKIDGHVVKDMTRLDCVRCLKESSVVIKLFVRHKNEKVNGTEIRVSNDSSPTVVSAEMKKTIPPPPPVPPRKIAKKSPTKEEGTVTPPEGFCDTQNNPIPKARNIQPVTDVNSSKFVIKVPRKGSHESPDLAKRIVKRTGSNLKLVPPEPKVYLDLFAVEDSRNCESESDDTGSTISTVVGMSVSNTTNSSFCDSTNPPTPTSEPTTPVLDLSKIYEQTNNEFLFTKLINGKDQDCIGCEDKIPNDDIAPLQPPLSFQDAPLSYGNEEMRANLTESLEFQNETINTEQEIAIEPESEEKCKDFLKATASKKPSLIPRLAKTIGFLSPPKPNPRKDPTGDKLRSKKKPPPLPPTSDNFSNLELESKTLKSSIPYLKKKKLKNDESKKNKSKSSNGGDEAEEKLNRSPNDDGDRANKDRQAPSTPENDRKLTWEVPVWKNSKETTEAPNTTKEKDEAATSSQNKPSLPDPQSSGDLSDPNESNFLFQWGGSKQLETIGEDEEDLNVDESVHRFVNNGAKEERSGEQSVKIVEEANVTPEVDLKQNVSEENEKGKDKSTREVSEVADEQPQEAVPESDCFGGKEDGSGTNGTKHNNGDFCSNRVLVKLEHDSSETLKDVPLNPANGEMNEVMVPVVSTTGLQSTPSYSRMPPDGHEFPQNFSEESNNQDEGVLPPLPASEPPSTPCVKNMAFLDGEADVLSDTKSFMKSARNNFWRKDEKSEKSVRDKIAMFSSVPESESSCKLSKYKSSEDVLYFDEADCKNLRSGKLFSQSILSLDKVSPFKKPYGVTSGPRSLDFTSRTQSSVDLSSSSAYSSSCSPDSSLSSNSSCLGYSSTLPRKKTNSNEKKETGEARVHRTTSFSSHGRSQSLLNVTPTYKSRYSSESSQDEGTKTSSLNLLIEQRRKNLSKLRGLVIPEKLSDVMPAQSIVDLPEIKSKDLILSSKVPSASTDKNKNKWTAVEVSTPPKLTPTHLWDQTAMPNIPKYSPAFKRKSISVFGSKQHSVKAPEKPPRNLQRFEDRKHQDLNLSDGEAHFPEKGQKIHDSPRPPESDAYFTKRNSALLGKCRVQAESGRSEEDSDNDSAVSSSRSSISHGFSPPASPLLDGQYHAVDDSRLKPTLLSSSPERIPIISTPSSQSVISPTSNTSSLAFSGTHPNTYAPEANNKRVLKPQSVEAINRKNVLTSAKYSRGFDSKAGSPLIQRKFSENVEEIHNHHPERKRSQAVKVAYITEIVENKKKLEKSESLPSEPSSFKPAAPRKTSVPFAYSWQTEGDASDKKEKDQNDERQFSAKDKSDKGLEYSSRRMKSEKNLSDSVCSVSLILSESNHQNVKRDPKSASNSEKTGSSGRRSASVNDIRKAFEKIETSVPPTPARVPARSGYCGINGNHVRVSSLDSTNSEDNCALPQVSYGFSNLQREQFGSITSLASSTSLISPQELQLLIEEANQTLEESGNNAGGSSPNNHDVLVIILHRDTVGGSVGITLAGGADYESKEITVHKVLAGSPADRDGRIQKGDRILSINGKSMKGVTHRESLAILKSPRLEVVLVVSRLKSDGNAEGSSPDDAQATVRQQAFLSGSSRPQRILEGRSLSEPGTGKGAEVEVEVDVARGPPVNLKLVKDGAGLGFSLEGGKDSPTGDRPLVIKKIFTGGAAEKCGELKAGDEIVNVNGIDVSVMSRIEVWKLMKQLPDGTVTITVRHQA